jgi:hypothetical protein
VFHLRLVISAPQCNLNNNPCGALALSVCGKPYSSSQPHNFAVHACTAAVASQVCVLDADSSRVYLKLPHSITQQT